MITRTSRSITSLNMSGRKGKLSKSSPSQNSKKMFSNKSNTSQNNINEVWPGPNHRVVTFFCRLNAPKFNVDPIAKLFGTVEKHTCVSTKNFNLIKVEMSTSAEAIALWNNYKTVSLPGVLHVTPDRNPTLQNEKHYEEFWSEADVKKGLESGELVSGNLRISSKNFRLAFISAENGKDVVIVDLLARNRALVNDVVAVKVNNESQWLRPEDKGGNREGVSNNTSGDLAEGLNKLSVNASNGNPATSPGKNNFSRTTNFKDVRKTGHVVAILERRHNRMASGKLTKQANQYRFESTNSTFPRIYIPKQQVEAKLNKQNYTNVMFTAKITDWDKTSLFPQGELCECIGNMGEIEAETRAILFDHDVDSEEFNESVTDCLPKQLPWSVPQAERERRRDFTNECIFSIDPSSARDLDDALHCKALGDGKYEVGVHIADVSHFVKPGTAVDQVANQRCTSVYMVQRVVPMLPRLLCEELCSLNPGQERLAFSVVWTLNEQGKVFSQWFGRSVINSCAKLSYDHAQSFIEKPERDFAVPDQAAQEKEFPDISGGYSLNVIKEKVLTLHKIAQNLREQRKRDGALRLDQVRLAFTLDLEKGLPIGCYPYQYKKSNELIEEFMLLANIAVAHRIFKNLPSQAFLRCHPEPKEEMMKDVVSHCNEIGLPIDATSSETLSHSLEQATGDDEYSTCRKQALFMLAIKPQQLAQYFCAGVYDDQRRYRHYALNVPLYTHFTSPIRRYADLVVHRQLAAVLGDDSDFKMMNTQVDSLNSQAQLCNHRKTNSKSAQEASGDLFFNVLVNNFGPLECRGMVMYVNDLSLDVLSVEYGVVKRVYFDKLPILAYKLAEQKVTGKNLQVNVVKLKWPTEDNKRPLLPEITKDKGTRPSYDSCSGIEQVIQVFDILPMVLEKSDPESVRSVTTSVKSPLVAPTISLATASSQ